MTQKNSPVVQTFLNIVKIDSPTGHEQKMTEYVANRLFSYGLEPYTDSEGNVSVYISGNLDLDPIFFNAHLDTVEPGRGINPRIDDGWIRSSGDTILGADNKSSVAAILSVIPKLQSLNKNHRPIDIFFTVSEEGDGHGAIGFDYSRLHSKNGYVFDIADEDFGTVITSAPFYNKLTIEIQGKSCHAKSPEKACNVLPVFIKAMDQLPLGRFSSDTLVNIGIVNCGSGANVIPGSMKIIGEVRGSVEEEIEMLCEKYRRTFYETAKKFGISVKFESLRENPGFKIEKGHPFLKDTLNLLREFGLKPKIKDSFGCADANYFSSHNLTTLVIADGSVGAHTVEEKIHVKDLERLVDLIYFLSTH